MFFYMHFYIHISYFIALHRKPKLHFDKYTLLPRNAISQWVIYLISLEIVLCQREGRLYDGHLTDRLFSNTFPREIYDVRKGSKRVKNTRARESISFIKGSSYSTNKRTHSAEGWQVFKRCCRLDEFYIDHRGESGGVYNRVIFAIRILYGQKGKIHFGNSLRYAVDAGFYARNPRSRRVTYSKQFASTERKLALQRKTYDYSRSIIRHDLFQDLGPLPLPGRNDLLYRPVLRTLVYLVVLFASLCTSSRLFQIR